MSCKIAAKTIENVIAFHGHSCPGLAIGIRASEAALEYFEGVDPSEMIAVVETDMCGVDAIQYLTGCTLGKGNLIHKDYGKLAFSFFHRTSDKGLRLLLNQEIRSELDTELRKLMNKRDAGNANEEDKNRIATLRLEMEQLFMKSELKEMFRHELLAVTPPRPARVLQSLDCEHCGESTMESRTRRFDGCTLCLPCFQKVEQKI